MAEDDNRSSGADERVDLTTIHVRGAIAGKRADLDWIVSRFTPLLLAQACYRLGPELRVLQEPEDLVNDTWLTAIPKLVQLDPEERTTPAVLQFLTTTLSNLAANLARKQLRRRRNAPVAADRELEDVAADHTGIVTRVVRQEAHRELTAVLEQMEERDRAVIVLRGIEQLPGKTVGIALGISEGAVAMRYQRALERLRGRVGRDVLDGLA